MTASAPNRLRLMTDSDLATVLEWRNHPNVRRFMHAQHIISKDEHSRWFERTSVDPQRHLLIYQEGRQPRGFVSIHEIGSGGIADWGFYAAPHSPSGTGRALGHAALQHAFSTLRLYKMCGQVLAYNELSIRFHLHLGFVKEGVLRQQHFDGETYHDIWCFGLLSDRWLVNP